MRKSAPETEALAQRLLAPLVTWRDRPVKAAAAEAAAPAVTEPAAPVIATDQGAATGSDTTD